MSDLNNFWKKIADGPMTNFLLFNETRGGRDVTCTDGTLTQRANPAANPVNSVRTGKDVGLMLSFQ
jgi:hypothetical protein